MAESPASGQMRDFERLGLPRLAKRDELLHRRGAAAARGGESADVIVVPTLKLDAEPWTYERFSKSFAEVRVDAGELGAIRIVPN